MHMHSHSNSTHKRSSSRPSGGPLRTVSSGSSARRVGGTPVHTHPQHPRPDARRQLQMDRDNDAQHSRATERYRSPQFRPGGHHLNQSTMSSSSSVRSMPMASPAVRMPSGRNGDVSSGMHGGGSGPLVRAPAAISGYANHHGLVATPQQQLASIRTPVRAEGIVTTTAAADEVRTMLLNIIGLTQEVSKKIQEESMCSTPVGASPATPVVAQLRREDVERIVRRVESHFVKQKKEAKMSIERLEAENRRISEEKEQLEQQQRNHHFPNATVDSSRSVGAGSNSTTSSMSGRGGATEHSLRQQLVEERRQRALCEEQGQQLAESHQRLVTTLEERIAKQARTIEELTETLQLMQQDAAGGSYHTVSNNSFAGGRVSTPIRTPRGRSSILSHRRQQMQQAAASAAAAANQHSYNNNSTTTNHRSTSQNSRVTNSYHGSAETVQNSGVNLPDHERQRHSSSPPETAAYIRRSGSGSAVDSSSNSLSNKKDAVPTREQKRIDSTDDDNPTITSVTAVSTNPGGGGGGGGNAQQTGQESVPGGGRGGDVKETNDDRFSDPQLSWRSSMQKANLSVNEFLSCIHKELDSISVQESTRSKQLETLL